MTLNILDLFSGIGGFSLGLERTGGFRTVAFCESDAYACRVLNKHWPDVPIYGDVRTLGSASLARDGIPSPDVVCGGFPCQDISLTGSGEGLAGARSGLWFEFLRIIGETRPQFAIIENVAALRNRGLDQVLRGLAAIGYDAEWHIISAASIGAPHRRERIWIVAYPSGFGRGTGRPWRLADGLAWLSDTPRWDPADADGTGLAQRQGVGGDARQKREAPERDFISDVWQSKWPSEPALCGMDDGLQDGMDVGLFALGNSLVPQIPEMIGHAILQSIGKD